MPTDLVAVITRKRQAQREKQRESQTNITMLSVLVIIYLVMLALVFVDKSYAQSIGQLETMEELIGLF
jgi:hypothetical protein